MTTGNERCNVHQFVYDCWRDKGHDGLHFGLDYYGNDIIGGREWADGDNGESWNYSPKEWPKDAFIAIMLNAEEKIVFDVLKEIKKDRDYERNKNNV
jgi:hypothetical protein